MRRKRTVLALLTGVFWSLAVVGAPAGPSPTPFEERCAGLASSRGSLPDADRFKRLLDLHWQYTLDEHPELSTRLGEPGRDDRWTDSSLAAEERRDRELEALAAVTATIDPSRLSDADRLSHQLFEHDLADERAERRFLGRYLRVTQLRGPQQSIPGMLHAMPARTVSEYENVLKRLAAVPEVIEDTLARLDEGLKRGVTPARVTLEKVPQQVLNVIPADPLQSALVEPFARIPESIPPPERERLRQSAVTLYRERAAPAFRKLHEYLLKTYLPGARRSIGMADLPDGPAWYAQKARAETTTTLTPDEIHRIGLAEVERIRHEMEAVIAATSFKGSFEEFVRFLRSEPRFYFDDAESLLRAHRDILKRVDPELVKLFGRLPRLPYGVAAMPGYAAESQTAAYYEEGSLAAARAGCFRVNTSNLKSRPRWGMEQLALHEAVPGHHLQIALAQEMEDLPAFRRNGGYTAFTEGWGLYAESLGADLGLYKDPYSRFGQLGGEMWRALRLVVDTGIHSKGWTRQQAIDLFVRNSAQPLHDVEVEIDRYIVNPGQALGYKIGELEIRKLRTEAQRELGERFDVRAFHDQVLGAGSIPLDVLARRVRAWIADRKALRR